MTTLLPPYPAVDELATEIALSGPTPQDKARASILWFMRRLSEIEYEDGDLGAAKFRLDLLRRITKGAR